MRLTIHAVWTSKFANIRKWVPDDPFDVYEIVCVSIRTGPRAQGTDDFMITVATPKGLASRPGTEGVVHVGPTLALEVYDFDVLWHWLNGTVRSCQAPRGENPRIGFAGGLPGSMTTRTNISTARFLRHSHFDVPRSSLR